MTTNIAQISAPSSGFVSITRNGRQLQGLFTTLNDGDKLVLSPIVGGFGFVTIRNRVSGEWADLCNIWVTDPAYEEECDAAILATESGTVNSKVTTTSYIKAKVSGDSTDSIVSCLCTIEVPLEPV